MWKYSWGEFDDHSSKLIREIRLLVKEKKIQSIYGIPRGGLTLAARLAYGLDLSIVEKEEISLTTLMVDDIARTGQTLKEFSGDSLYVVTLFWCKTSTVQPTFYVQEVVDFVEFPWAPEDKPGRTEKK